MYDKSTIVTDFLNAYEMGGTAYNAIEAVRELHELHLSTKSFPLTGKLKQYYSEVLPKQVQEQTEAFDFSTVGSGRISPIIAKIDRDLKGLAGDERQDYLFDLLKPFGELARIYNPTAVINSLQSFIEGLERDRAMWESQPQDQDKPLFGIDGKPADSPQKQAEACSGMIEYYNGYIERLSYINGRFCDILNNSESGTIEYYCSVWVSAATQFANRLDALLLTYGIDFLELQEISGIYLKDHREITDVDYYFGSVELAQHYINALPPRRPSSTLADDPAADTLLRGNQHPASQEPTRGRGRPKETLKDKMIDDAKGEKLQKIHTKMIGKKGKDAALIILACIKKGWMTKPTYTQVKNEFGDIGSKTGYNRYLNEKMFTKEELEGVINSLD